MNCIASLVMPTLVLLMLGDPFYFSISITLLCLLKKDSNVLITPVDLQKEIITAPYISLKQDLILIN